MDFCLGKSKRSCKCRVRLGKLTQAQALKKFAQLAAAAENRQPIIRFALLSRYYGLETAA